MESRRPDRIKLLLVAIIVVNALITGYLFKTVADQNRRIQTLERNDAIKQKVDRLNTKVDSLKQRVEDFFR